MLEQVSHIEAVKKTPFPIDSTKAKPSSKGGAEPAPDFKSVLEKSLQEQAHTSTPTANAKASTQHLQAAQKLAKEPASPQASAKQISTKQIGTKQASTKIESPSTANALPSTTATPSTPTPASLAPKGEPLGASKEAPQMLAQALESSAPKQSVAPSLSQDSAPLPALASNQTQDKPQAPQQKKSLNDMAKLEPQESFLSKITQNASKAESSSQPKVSGTNAQVESSAPSVKGASAKLDSSGANDIAPESNAIQQALQASALVAGAQEVAQSPSPAKPSAPSTPAAPTSLTSAPLQDGTPKATPANALAKPTLGDVVQKAQDLGLNPSKAEFTQQEEEFKNSVQARTGMRQVSPSSDGIRQFFDKQDEQSLRPFFSMLSAANALDAAARRSSKANRIEYAIESKTEKIAIINRGKTLPKNITESRLKNERQERVFEQIQKDIIAGKELDLEQIKAELFTSKVSESPKPLAQPASPSQPAQRLASTAAAMAAPALVQGAQEALRESQKSSKDPREQAPRAKAKAAQTAQMPSAESSKDSSPLRAELESSTPKELARAMESELELADMDLPKEFELERAQEKSPKSAKQAQGEQKAESKLESKLATSAALGASAMKQELSKPQVREMITSFVNQFDQEVKKFKPPMNKISLELNPKELGNIELTITQRGNNLHISVISNPQAITLFAQNQLDLRQSLIAQGFDGIDLSFSQNSSGGFGSGSQNNDQASKDNAQGGLESGLEYMAKDSSEPSMEITLPLYA